MQSQQTVTLITDTIKKPWFSVCLYRADCQVLECICFNDTHCLRNSPQKMYPQHNIRIQVPDLLQCRTGSIPTLLWQLPDYQKVQYTFRIPWEEKKKEKKKRETSPAAAVLCIIKYTATWLPQKRMDAQAEWMLPAEVYLKIWILTQRDASKRNILSLLCI